MTKMIALVALLPSFALGMTGSPSSQASVYVSGTVSNLNDTVVAWNLPPTSAAFIAQVILNPSSSLTVDVECSVDGSTWHALEYGTSNDPADIVISFSAGAVRGSVAGCRHARMRCNSYVNGSATVAIAITSAFVEHNPTSIGPADAGLVGAVSAIGSADTTNTLRYVRSATADPGFADLGLIVREAPRSNSWNASLTNSTATTLTQIQSAPGVGSFLYVTSVTMSSSAASTTTADQQLTLKYGTGANCAVGTTVAFSCFNVANSGCSSSFPTPIKIPDNNALCFVHAATGNKSVHVQGFTSN